MSQDPPNDQPASDANPARFEESLAELEQLVEQLERGDLTLEESLAQFERGVGLARECRESLSAAEQKVQVLLERAGEGEQLADFDTGGDEQADRDADS
ncbi:MAG: exodeoxyribonuclease VII small subunit [Halofilum sp. (in: g-proteobacteria)]